MESRREKISSLILRLGLAFAFIYAGVAGFIDPNSWIGWFPPFARGFVPDTTLLAIWGVFEIVLALWILSGKNIFWPSLVASLSLAGLILTNLSQMDVIFRDVTILAVAVALAIANFPEKTTRELDERSSRRMTEN